MISDDLMVHSTHGPVEWRGLLLAEIDDGLERRMRTLLDVTESARVSKFVHRSDARRFIAGRYLVRQLIAERCELSPVDVVICIDSRGKPILPQISWHFSISHGGDWIVVAVSRDCLVGVDVEAVTATCPIDLVPLALHPDEIDSLVCLPNAARSEFFFWLWTRKEAILKASGCGLVCDPRTLRVLEDVTPEKDCMPRCQVATLAALNGHCLSLAWSRL